MHAKFKVELSVAALACLPQELLQSKEENPLKVFTPVDLQMATQQNYPNAIRQENVTKDMFLTKSKQKKKSDQLKQLTQSTGPPCFKKKKINVL